ncbi:cytochrome c-type biogenesis protein CcsB [Streptomyces sp. DvalAA-14]|uniref:c-type cytochrome biogenesis protein CcsB n=1 Tax=unclassified Streptomyces TaxID=2593676 RepID=UPI00081B232E|nr:MULTISPECIES: c-type cytochrome biogenesis protein CcsB [unclassified Streptomyces]MYS20179.1 c-type cytochrome biogenesis protein CcsB [Streptomyces sp. SID4948]SCD62659.1 cytochrome c-type biogenesis protein CcsB [Streptomyces sp. DvalAA-14]
MNLAAAVNENFANYSNYLIRSAMFVYALAFLAHLAEWVFGGRSKVAVQSAALLTEAAEQDAAAGTAPVTVQVTRRDGGTTTIERPTVVTRASASDRGIADGPGAAGSSEKGDLYGRIAISFTALAWVLHVAGVVFRAASVGRAPWGNMYEFSTTFGAVAVGVYLLLLALKKDVRWIGLFLTTTVLLDLGLALSVLYTSSEQLVPALHSYWLWIHVSCAIISGAIFYLAAVGTLLYLFRDHYELALTAGRAQDNRWGDIMRRLPAAASLDKFAYRMNALVFPLWTFTIIAGAIWAQAAWGHYWEWDPKETWSFITWVAYAGYLHARATAGWKGRKAAYLALIAFACFLFNYYGVNIFVTGKHSYAGV